MTNSPNSSPEEKLPPEEIGFNVADPDDSIAAAAKGSGPKMSKKKKAVIIIVSVLLSLSVLLAGTVGILWATGKASLLGYKVNVSIPDGDSADTEEDGSRVRYNGETYVYNKNAVNILFMGIDKNDVNDEKGYGKNGQADSIMVLNFDTKTGKIKILPISREIMTDVSMYSAEGNYIGVKRTQLCLAYAYGANGKESCENVRQAVSRLLYGVEIGSYIAIDMDGVTALADAIGGVRLTPIETMPESNIKEGVETFLKGKMINSYLRSRDQDEEANNRRMLRQKQFIGAFASQAGNQALSDIGKLASLYNKAAPYTVTDITLSEVTYIAGCCLTADMGNAIEYSSISGETHLGEEYMEFTADRTSLLEAILNTFYLKG